MAIEKDRQETDITLSKPFQQIMSNLADRFHMFWHPAVVFTVKESDNQLFVKFMHQGHKVLLYVTVEEKA